MEPLRVLIVDDEEELVAALVERLDIRGIDAVGVNGGAEALERVEAEHFDVVLLDLKMPGISGRELIDRIHRRQPDLRVVLLTGHGAAENVELGHRIGAVDCLMKPVQIETLLEILNKAAGRS